MAYGTMTGLGALGDGVTAAMISAAGAFVVALALCLRRPRRRPVDLPMTSAQPVADSSISNARSL